MLTRIAAMQIRKTSPKTFFKKRLNDFEEEMFLSGECLSIEFMIETGDNELMYFTV